MVQKGYPEKSFQQAQQDKTWFIFHNGKSGKTRVVFE